MDITVANRIEDVNCRSFLDYNDDKRQAFFLTKLFGSTPNGEVVDSFKLLKSGKPSTEQRRIEAVAESMRSGLDGVHYVWFEHNGFGDYFHVFPYVFVDNGRTVVGGMNVEVCSSIRNRMRKSYGSYYVNIERQLNLGVFLLNNYTNKMPNGIDEYKGSYFYIHRLIDYEGNVENIVYAPNDVRFSEAKELIRLYNEAEPFTPNFGQCLVCKIRCEKMINSFWV